MKSLLDDDDVRKLSTNKDYKMHYDHICKVNCFTKANRIAKPKQIGWETQTHGVLCMFVYHVSLWTKQNRRGEKWKISFLSATRHAKTS